MGSSWQDAVLNDIDRYYRLAYSYVKNQQDASDIIQESLYKALKQQDSIKNNDAIKTWFYRIVVNTSLDFIRKGSKVVFLDENAWESLSDDDEDTIQNEDLRDAVDRLPFKYKTVITLRYFDDLKISDIAQIMNENENTIKTRIYAALKKLKVQLKEVV